MREVKTPLECGDLPGLWQNNYYEKIPYYCKHCYRLRHDFSVCKVAADPMSSDQTEKKGKEQVQQVFRPKQA